MVGNLRFWNALKLVRRYGRELPAIHLPGIVGQTLLFTSMFMGISVIWDREFGFLKEILVAPISRVSVFVGKMLGGSTDAVIQGSFVFVFSFLVSNPRQPRRFPLLGTHYAANHFWDGKHRPDISVVDGESGEFRCDSDLRQSSLVLHERRLVSAREFSQMAELGERRRPTDLWC